MEVHYTGWTTDGKMFDSSRTRGQPARFPLRAVIAGWTEGLQLMTVGEQRRLWIPEALAYKGVPGRPAGMLVFDVELLSIVAPPKAPEDVGSAPQRDAKKNQGQDSLTKCSPPGSGTKHPEATSVVTGPITPDGRPTEKCSTVLSKETAPQPFRLVASSPDGPKACSSCASEKKRAFGSQKDLAYKGRPNAPKGMLVFDVELLNISKGAPPPPPPKPSGSSKTGASDKPGNRRSLKTEWQINRNAQVRSQVLGKAGPEEPVERTRKYVSRHRRVQCRMVPGSGLVRFCVVPPLASFLPS